MKRKLILTICALLALAFSLGMFAGCDLLETDNERDMAQVVAEVNVADNTEELDDAFTALGTGVVLSDEVRGSLGSIVSTDEVYKRDLVTYFLSYGYNYISSGYSYAETFDLLITALADRKVVSQFATLYYLSADEITVDSDYVDLFELSATDAGYTQIGGSDGYRMSKDLSVSGYLAAIGGEDLTADEAAIAGYSYFLTDAELAYAHYLVKNAINSAIDSYEEDIINAETTDDTSDDRATPTGADTLNDYYYPTEYEVYTGLNEATDCGEYETVDDSSRSTRRLAYARFISALRSNNLIGDDESVSDVTQLEYYSTELKSQLEQLIITKFSSTIDLTMSDAIEAQLLQNAYNELVATQQVSSESDFTTTMDSVSDTSFIVYSPEGKYGFVYNILLPFNTNQELALSELQAQYGSDTAEYYAARASLYQHITATDQRESWFNGAEDYSFKAADAGYTEYYGYPEREDAYLFFEDSLTKSRDGIDRYAGKYPYNGTVSYDEEKKTYDLDPEDLTVDAFITEFEAYINYIAGSDKANGGYTDGSDGSGFYAVSADDIKQDWKTNKNDYSFAIYYTGKVSGVSDISSAEYLVKDNISYKALSAVNELMFAYTTDTAALNTYYGYSIETQQEATDYVAEFEYAAQYLINDSNYGTGSYCVVATDYGWHLIYVTFTYDGGLVYYSDDNDDTNDGFVYTQRNEKGTFSYYFYQSMKSSVISSYTEEKQNDLLNALEEVSVTLYEDRYSDLTSIDM